MRANIAQQADDEGVRGLVRGGAKVPETIKNIGIQRLVAILGVTAGVAAALAAIVLRLGSPPMTVLYTDLPYEDAQSVIERLEQSDIPYQLKGGRARATVLVPKNEALRLRMTLAEEGLPRQGSMGYELFDQGNAFGATSFQQNLNRVRALEGELARTITALDGVRAARVHLVLPERALFSRDQQSPSASIVIDAPRGVEPRTVRAVRNLVASAVPDLQPGRVTLLDNSGVLLAAAQNEADDGAALAALTEERTAAAESRIRRTVSEIVGGIVGVDRVRVQVSAEMNFNRISETAEIFDPDGRVALSTVTVEESSTSEDPDNNAGVSVGENLPGADIGGQGAGVSRSSNQRTEETTNFEISKTVRNEVRETGVIERLSVAVAIDGIYESAADGTDTYTPRSDDELQKISALVKSAIGYNEERGDQVEIVNMPFERVAAGFQPIEEVAEAGLGKDDFIRIGEIAVLGILGVILAMFVLKPMLQPAASAEAATANGAPAMLAAAPAGEAAHGAPAGPGVAALGDDGAGGRRALPHPDGEHPLQQQIDFARLQGQIKTTSVKEISDLVKDNTDESAAVMRNWIGGV